MSGNDAVVRYHIEKSDFPPTETGKLHIFTGSGLAWLYMIAQYMKQYLLYISHKFIVNEMSKKKTL
jgi:hypothetical protein